MALVEELMTKNPVCVDYNDSLDVALSQIKEHEIRHLPVIKEEQLAGIISDRDLKLYAVVLEIQSREFKPGKVPDLKVKDLMQTGVVSVLSNEEVSTAIRLLIENRIGALPVLDPKTQKLIGILSYVDVLEAVEDLV